MLETEPLSIIFMANTFSKYGYDFPVGTSDLAVEMSCIRNDIGLGKSHHYEQMRKILWPRLDSHRWHTLCRDEILHNKITVLMGPASSGKTHEAAWIFLCEYYCFPQDTCVLVSSTDLRGLELRVWGEIKMLHQEAKDKYPELPGFLIDHLRAITTDDIQEEDVVRDMRRGIIGVPCIQNGKFTGLQKYCGIKQKRMRLIADECQFMGGSFLSAIANLDKNPDFKAVFLGNPNDVMDPLGKAAEPRDGWSAHMEPEKTSVWDTRFMGGRCVNLIGTDSPNFDYPPNEKTRFPYLISKEKIANTLSFFPKDSIEYYSQCIGAMKVGVLARRVITRDLCVQFGAFDDAIWIGETTTKIGALDAAYGGDRCVGGHIEFGKAHDGQIILKIFPPVIVPIKPKSDKIPEDQIAEYMRMYCAQHRIDPENFFHDSTGRGSLGTSLSRIWSPLCNPVEFGGTPTKRPVRYDLFVVDDETGERRLKLCSEHYSKWVTEAWFSVRYAIESGQMRNLPEEIMEEGCMREWRRIKGDKIELETKEDMKVRVGRSPDLFDWLAIAVEGARRRGFQIKHLGDLDKKKDEEKEWLQQQNEEFEDILQKHLLSYA